MDRHYPAAGVESSPTASALLLLTGFPRLSYLIWGDIPKLQVFLGAGLIIASGMLVILGEWQARRKSLAPAAETATADLRTGK